MTFEIKARALCLRLSDWLDGNRDELAPIRIPSEAQQRRREGTRRRHFLTREIRALANRGHGQVSEYCHVKLPHRWWGARFTVGLSMSPAPKTRKQCGGVGLLLTNEKVRSKYTAIP